MAAPGEAQLIEASAEAWPLAKPFVIARGAKTAAHVVVARVAGGGHTGRGEAVPYARYGETVEGALHALRGLHGPLTREPVAGAFARRRRPQCARLCAVGSRSQARRQAGLGPRRHPGAAAPAMTCYTLSLGDPAQMAADATRSAASEAAQAEARRRGRPRAHGRGARRPPRCAPRRRRQRGVDAGAAGAVSRRRRRRRRRADRAAAARRRRRGACPHQARGARVRR